MKSEKDKLLKKICRKAGVTIRDHQMLQKNDHVLLGLSGGKDSMILLEVLADRRSALPFPFEITAAHIQVEDVGYKAGVDVMRSLCRELSINFVEKSIRIKDEDKDKGICFLCSWNRRKALFELSVELNCNKIAFGHHRYDALETLLMNMIYHGSISSMPYSLSMFNGRVKLIRPLLDQDENLLKDYAQLRNYQAEGIKCNYEHENKRSMARELINTIETEHPRGSINMFRSMNKVLEEYLPQKKARTL